MKHLKVCMALCLLVSTSAFALDEPNRSRFDGRIKSTEYNEEDVVAITTVNGYSTEILFDKNEEIIKYGSGYSTAWDFHAWGNHFYLKPKAPHADTNLFITTNRRNYSFDLKLVPNKSQATYRLTFSYSTEVNGQNKRNVLAERMNTSIVNPIASDGQSLAVGTNYNYTMRTNKDFDGIAPVEAYDNQHFTVLRFKTNSDFPTAYRVTQDGEVLVNSHVESGALVLHGVYPELVLRAGRSVVGVYNESYTGGGIPIESGVSVPGVERTILK